MACDPTANATWLPVAALEAEPTELDLPPAGVGTEARAELTVTNTGHATASVTVAATAPFSAASAILDLAPGESAVVLVTAAVPAVGAFDGQLVLGDLRVPLHLVGEADHDRDGYVSARAGGTDCDDDDPDTYPGATESSEDVVDRDCNGVAGDADGDGTPSTQDCDDDDPSTYPGAPERIDAKDNDCDGRVDEIAVQTGALVLAEFRRADPSWAELCVPVDRTAVAIGGFVLATDQAEVVLDPTTIEPGACLAICAANMGGCSQRAEMSLASAAWLQVRADDAVDSVEVGVFADAGTLSWSLDPRKLDAEDNDDPAAWCTTAGSAGSPNPRCAE
jgi:hypothetical protein